ncbi:MAG: hypothetical protein KY443_08975 [Actinobacteria bacterium]|nr:hypothetical protein [Actinomycetota bacterium]
MNGWGARDTRVTGSSRQTAGVARLLATLLASLVLFAACSGDNKDGNRADGTPSGSPEAYAADYQAVTQTFEADVERLRSEGRTVVGRGKDALLTFYESFAAATAIAREKYGSLRPPDDLAALHGRLVDLLERQAAVLDAVVEGARGGAASLDRELQELARLLTDWTQVNRELSRRLTSTT